MNATEAGQKIVDWSPILKMGNMNATLISELDRLAADYDMTADECLMELMRVRAEQEGAEAVRIMVETATDLWSNFKPGASQGRYWAMRRARRETETKADMT